MEPLPKFKIGQKVSYVPKLSGLVGKLEIEFMHYKSYDEISSAFGLEFQPTWMYHFKDISLSASEDQLRK